jgi:hypothetical protein
MEIGTRIRSLAIFLFAFAVPLLFFCYWAYRAGQNAAAIGLLLFAMVFVAFGVQSILAGKKAMKAAQNDDDAYLKNYKGVGGVEEAGDKFAISRRRPYLSKFGHDSFFTRGEYQNLQKG